MDWIQVIVIIFGNAAWVLPILFWIRSESRADWRNADLENKQLRRDLVDVMRCMEKEMRDFHGRLCAIEERRLKGK